MCCDLYVMEFFLFGQKKNAPSPRQPARCPLCADANPEGRGQIEWLEASVQLSGEKACAKVLQLGRLPQKVPMDDMIRELKAENSAVIEEMRPMQLEKSGVGAR